MLQFMHFHSRTSLSRRNLLIWPILCHFFEARRHQMQDGGHVIGRLCHL
jgi:hypothetical protein